MRPVIIVDCGVSNIDSCVRAVEYCGGDPVVTRDPAVVREAGRVILPGVGAFPALMQRLNETGLADAVRESALTQERPLLGICLGMQVLASSGEELEWTEGLGIVPGRVQRLQPGSRSERVPHIGWNAVEANGVVPILEDGAAKDFYFVHSFAFAPDDAAHTLATTPNYGGFASVVGKGLAFGVQFHPEKSQAAGFALLRGFIEL